MMSEETKTQSEAAVNNEASKPTGQEPAKEASKQTGQEPAKVEKDAGPSTQKTEKPKETEEIRQIVRLRNTDLDGRKQIGVEITRIQGVGHNIAKSILKLIKIDPHKKLGLFQPAELERVEKAIMDPGAVGVPVWMLNRQADIDTGKDIHLNTADLEFARKADIDRMGSIKSYKGMRHARGLKVRGQRTKSTGRGNTTLGVVRRKDMKAGK